MKKNQQIARQNTFADFLLYTTPNGEVKAEIFLRDENLWLTQKRMADLFGVGIPAVNKRLKNIFETGELQEDSVVSVLEISEFMLVYANPYAVFLRRAGLWGKETRRSGCCCSCFLRSAAIARRS